jgi:hypothetical protein
MHPHHQRSTTSSSTLLNDRQKAELDDRYQNFRELLQKFNDREEQIKQKLLRRDEMLESIGFYQQLFHNYNDLLESACINVDTFEKKRDSAQVVAGHVKSLINT